MRHKRVDKRKVNPKKKMCLKHHISMDPDLSARIEVYRINRFDGEKLITFSSAARELIEQGLESLD